MLFYYRERTENKDRHRETWDREIKPGTGWAQISQTGLRCWGIQLRVRQQLWEWGRGGPTGDPQTADS